MPTVDFDAQILSWRNKPIPVEEPDEKGKPEEIRYLTLGELTVMGCLDAGRARQGEKMSEADQLRGFTLAVKAQGTQELSVKDVAFILKRIAALGSPLYTGRAYQLLDPDGLKVKE